MKQEQHNNKDKKRKEKAKKMAEILFRVWLEEKTKNSKVTKRNAT